MSWFEDVLNYTSGSTEDQDHNLQQLLVLVFWAFGILLISVFSVEPVGIPVVMLDAVGLLAVVLDAVGILAVSPFLRLAPLHR